MAGLVRRNAILLLEDHDPGARAPQRQLARDRESYDSSAYDTDYLIRHDGPPSLPECPESRIYKRRLRFQPGSPGIASRGPSRPYKVGSPRSPPDPPRLACEKE
ncbi:hypothetical protein GCM10010403_18890 [Glycomyces rutgersensis]|uniref:Uncharacterized protein n=1 Tax=Glycomyces rutgersensis TaxID=58115 RepID=A0ABP5SAN8_9ACTN